MTDIETSIREKIFCDVIDFFAGYDACGPWYKPLMETILGGPQAPASRPKQQAQTAKVIPFPRVGRQGVAHG